MINAGSKQCNLCSGNGKVTQGSGAVQVCPGCNGSGRMEPPWNRVPMTYVFGNGSTITLAGGIAPGTPGVSTNAQLNLGGDFDFELESLVAISNPGAAAGAWQDQIQIYGSYAWQPQGVFIQNACRWGATIGLPNELKPRIIVPRRGQFTGIFQDMSGAQNILQPCFVGWDLHPVILPAGVAQP